jgi:hypothetical protein
MHRHLAEELRLLLRRIEEIPDAGSPAPVARSGSRLGTGAQPGAPALALPVARSAGPTLRRYRKLAALALFGVAAIAAIAAARSSPWSNEDTGHVPPADETRTALVPPPTRDEETPTAPAGAITPPVAQAEPAAEAHEQTALPPDALKRSFAVPAARPAPKPTLMVPPIHAISGQRVRVAMRIEPGTLSATTLEVSVHGLPRGARFVPGTLRAPDRWVIPASALGKLELALGDAAPGRFELVSELHGASGRPIMRTRSALVVAAPPARSLASSRSRLAGVSAPVGRVFSATNCRPCRCFRASPVYWVYRGAGTWMARAGPETTTCYVTTSNN